MSKDLLKFFFCVRISIGMEYVQALDIEKSITSSYETQIIEALKKSYVRFSCQFLSGTAKIKWYGQDNTHLYDEVINPLQESIIFSSVRMKASKYNFEFIPSGSAYLRIQVFEL
jgi:hypothetical protein